MYRTIAFARQGMDKFTRTEKLLVPMNYETPRVRTIAAVVEFWYLKTRDIC
jgi:hypothetical protein